MVKDIPNVCNRLIWKKGDIDQGFREADLVLEHTFRFRSAIRVISSPKPSSSRSMRMARSWRGHPARALSLPERS